MKIIRRPPTLDLATLISQHPDFLTKVGDAEVVATLQHANDSYLHWDKFRWRPMPHNLPRELVWAYLKLQRLANQRPVTMTDVQGKSFSYWLPDRAQRILSFIDRSSGSLMETDRPDPFPKRERYIVSSLMDEAIASSQLEGAATTRPVAKAMLRSGRKPRNHHEQMIYNKWQTIQHLRENKKDVLTPEFVCSIHAMITEGTLEDANDSGQIRTRDDVVVQYNHEVVHYPPPASMLKERLEALCRFINTEDTQHWTHPVVKATILHFWLGYDHPFVDGNGRTARALFYWYLLSHDYWLVEYLAISRYFLKAPSQYARAYLYTETDGGDLTYFLMYNLRVVNAAFQELRHYLQRKQHELVDA